MKLWQSLLFFLTIASANNLPVRDANSVLNDISVIASQLLQVQKDIAAFQGGPTSALQALKIQTDSTTLGNTIKKSTQDVIDSQQFSDEQSAQIAFAVTALQPDIYNVLNALVAKKSGFQTALFGASADPIVKSTLKTLRSDTADLGGNITSKLVSEVARVAPLITSDIDFHYVRAIQAFSS